MCANMSENRLLKKFDNDLTYCNTIKRRYGSLVYPMAQKLYSIFESKVMSTAQDNQLQEKDDEQNESSTIDSSLEANEDDGTPVLDEEDLEENDLSVEEAEDIEWEEPNEGEKE
jgi:hypothetical protein